MLGGLISAGSKALGGARFSLISVMPGFLVIAVVAVLVRAHLYDPASPADFSAVMLAKKDALGAALFLLLAFLGGVLLRPFEAAVVQLLEGYWASPITSLRHAAVERHRRRRLRAQVEIDHADGSNSRWGTEPVALEPPPVGMRPLAELVAEDRALARKSRGVARARQIRRGYPVKVLEPDEPMAGDDQAVLLPTLLGNALLRGERLSGDRYGLDMPTVGPRIYPFISPRLQGAINQQMDLISASASLCVSLTVATAAMLPLLARLDGWSFLPLIPACMAAVAYRGAVAAALAHGRLLCTVFDLHRFDLIKAFHYVIPSDAEGVSALNRRISEFLAAENVHGLDRFTRLDSYESVHHPDDQDVLQRTDRDGPAQT
ncbi:hypothetical protein [Streptomyces sp. NPDC050988]|uniref:hypothetical protein n=1 Tax=Streptomyces sp. NPDC050988 TaxID=3365637 RepID=UPI00379CD0B5